MRISLIVKSLYPKRELPTRDCIARSMGVGILYRHRVVCGCRRVEDFVLEITRYWDSLFCLKIKTDERSCNKGKTKYHDDSRCLKLDHVVKEGTYLRYLRAPGHSVATSPGVCAPQSPETARNFAKPCTPPRKHPNIPASRSKISPDRGIFNRRRQQKRKYSLPDMPREVSDIKQFIEICRRKDATCELNRCSSFPFLSFTSLSAFSTTSWIPLRGRPICHLYETYCSKIRSTDILPSLFLGNCNLQPAASNEIPKRDRSNSKSAATAFSTRSCSKMPTRPIN